MVLVADGSLEQRALIESYTNHILYQYVCQTLPVAQLSESVISFSLVLPAVKLDQIVSIKKAFLIDSCRSSLTQRFSLAHHPSGAKNAGHRILGRQTTRRIRKLRCVVTTSADEHSELAARKWPLGTLLGARG